MGMFDWVNAEIICKKCGNKCGCQTKSGPCALEILEPTEINAFHSYCDQCKIMYHYVRESSEVRTHRVVPYSESEIEDMGFKLLK
jgi:hypothetical protein